MPNITEPALQSLEKEIGIPAQAGVAIPDFEISPQRNKVISYLIIKGLPKSNCDTCTNETLGKLYGISKYLQAAIDNERMGKNKYKRREVKIDFDDTQTETPIITETDSDIQSDSDKQLSIRNKVETETLIRNLVRTTINEELIQNRNMLQSENTKLQDAIIKTVHDSVQESLSKSWEENAKHTKEIAERITENKIKHEEENLKNLVEDIIFQSYLNNKIQTSPAQAGGTNLDAANLDENANQIIQNEDNPHIPKIDPNYHFDPYATKVIRSALSMNENLYVYGDTGCGKTTHLEQVCSVLNRGIVRVNPHDGITREMFLGGMKLINNETIFVPGALPLAMRNGYVFLVDEISFLPPNLTAILNPIGEKGGKLYIPETSEWITPQPGFCIFATDNTGGKGDRTGNYTGTEVQNTATLDRFAFCLKMNYLPQEKENDMLEKRFPNQNKDEIINILSLARDIRSAFSRGELSLTLSTRKLIKFFDQRENNFTIQEALSNTILSWLDEDDETLVKTMIDRLDLLNGDQK